MTTATAANSTGQAPTAADNGMIDVAGCYSRCPKAHFDLVPIAECPQCDAFRGLDDRFPGMASPAKRYLVLCAAEPIKREIFAVARGA